MILLKAHTRIKLQHFLFLLPLSSGLGASESQSWVNEPLSLVFVLPLVRDLIRTVVTISVGLIHNSGIETSDHLRHVPLEVIHDGVGHGVVGDILVVGGLPEGDHVLPDAAVHSVLAKSLRLMFSSATCTAHCDLHTLVTETGLDILTKLDVLGSKLLDQLISAADT